MPGWNMKYIKEGDHSDTSFLKPFFLRSLPAPPTPPHLVLSRLTLVYVSLLTTFTLITHAKTRL